MPILGLANLMRAMRDERLECDRNSLAGNRSLDPRWEPAVECSSSMSLSAATSRWHGHMSTAATCFVILGFCQWGDCYGEMAE